MKKFLFRHRIGFVISLAMIFSLFLFNRIYATSTDSEQHYVKGKYGKYCYEIHNYPHQIKYFIYFDSYEDCLNSLSTTTEK